MTPGQCKTRYAPAGEDGGGHGDAGARGTRAAGTVDGGSKRLADLTAGLATVPATLFVRDVTLDSRTASPGSLFWLVEVKRAMGCGSRDRLLSVAPALCCTKTQRASAKGVLTFSWPRNWVRTFLSPPFQS